MLALVQDQAGKAVEGWVLGTMARRQVRAQPTRAAEVAVEEGVLTLPTTSQALRVDQGSW